MTEIRTAIERATTYLQAHPDEAEYTDGPATATLESGLRVRTTGPGDEAVQTDMPSSIGGQDSAPSPGWLLRAAAASCVATLIAMRASQLGYVLDGLQVTVDSVSDDRGILGLDPSIPAGPLRGRILVSLLSGEADRTVLEDLATWGVDHCPVVDALRRPVPLEVVTST